MRRTNAFHAALKRARLDRGLTQEEFDLVSSRTYISMLERNLRTPTLEKIDDLADTLGLHPLTLIALAYLDDLTPGTKSKLLKLVDKELATFKK